MTVLKRGLIQIYTGDGKGKTTAALGAAWRMLGRGGNVYICQFLKPTDMLTGEATTARVLISASGHSGMGRLLFDRLDDSWDMLKAGSDSQQFGSMQQAITDKLREIAQNAASGRWDMIILDEIIYCLSINLLNKSHIVSLLDVISPHTELILTGRGLPGWLADIADLITEMRCCKHPYQKGITARSGIEY